MSIQFGRWHYEGAPATSEYVGRIRTLMEKYALDGSLAHVACGVSILYCALHTTKESARESQPCVIGSGAIVTWDGRLDNRDELIATMSDKLGADSPDASVVAAAYDRWGTECFARLLGDWALSIWDPRDRSLLLAKDPIGVRPLYYSIDRNEVTWSSLLEPLVHCSRKTFALNEEYIAGYFSLFPATHLTPYQGVASVPASAYVRIRAGNEAAHKYWDFDPEKRICYRSDADYQDHFRTVFEESVRRRLRSSGAVLAELSGGIDSSSIVCVADAIIADRTADTQRLDTLSYFNDSEPNWNERPYVSEIEKMRGRTGCHIDLAGDHPFAYQVEATPFQAAPGSRPMIGQSAERRAACLRNGGYRVLLSGIGGDEVTGGVPTPVPELADLVACARFRRLAHQLKAWALVKRKPWFHLFLETAGRFIPSSMGGGAIERAAPVSWLDPAFVARQRRALSGYQDRLRLFGPFPSFQEALSTLDALRRQFACDDLPSDPPYEKRYPFLDRDLLEFLFAIPREQLVRPGERRSLMRRALAGVVPEKVLFRRRKAYISRAPLVAISQEQEGFADLTKNMIAASLGIVDARSFVDTLAKVREGKEAPIVSLFRTLDLEFWLRNQKQHMSIEHGVAPGQVVLSQGGTAARDRHSLDEEHQSLI